MSWLPFLRSQSQRMIPARHKYLPLALHPFPSGVRPADQMQSPLFQQRQLSSCGKFEGGSSCDVSASPSTYRVFCNAPHQSLHKSLVLIAFPANRKAHRFPTGPGATAPSPTGASPQTEKVNPEGLAFHKADFCDLTCCNQSSLASRWLIGQIRNLPVNTCYAPQQTNQIIPPLLSPIISHHSTSVKHFMLI